MAVFSKHVLSGSSDGKNILVAATATLGTTIHTSHATSEDEIWIYAYNNSGSAINLTIQWGGATTTDNILQSIPSQQGLILVIPGLILTNSLVVTAFASTGNQIALSGFVNRIT